MMIVVDNVNLEIKVKERKVGGYSIVLDKVEVEVKQVGGGG